jgi:hypothetical protein
MLANTAKADAKRIIKVLRDDRKLFEGNQKKAREYLIRMGILDRSGKRLARRYR